MDNRSSSHICNIRPAIIRKRYMFVICGSFVMIEETSFRIGPAGRRRAFGNTWYSSQSRAGIYITFWVWVVGQYACIHGRSIYDLKRDNIRISSIIIITLVNINCYYACAPCAINRLSSDGQPILANSRHAST